MTNLHIILLKIILLLKVSTGEPIVNLPDGPVLGIQHTTATNLTYYGFHGIPYAKPPLGKLRFMSPRSTDSWTGLWNATYDRMSCISFEYTSKDESEDCLYINIFTPDLKPIEGLPVIFWIYGGAFVEGKANFDFYGPQYLMEEQNVILVSFGYRVGVFGFLSTNDEEIPGNAGWKDMLKALEWIYDNVALFGGDPKKITIAGNSAGAASVGILMTNEKAKGKFRAAVLSSGSAFACWSVNSNSSFIMTELLASLSRLDLVNDTQQAKAFLQNLTVVELLAAAPPPNPFVYQYPTIEPESDEAFYSQYKYELFKAGNYSRVPTMLGVTSGESVLFLKDLIIAKNQAQFVDTHNKTLIPTNLNVNSSDYNAVIADIKRIYLNNGDRFSEDLPAYMDYFSDYHFRKAVIRQADLEAQFNSVYLYNFAYHGRRLLTPALKRATGKVSHGGDIVYTLYVSPYHSTHSTDLLIQRRMTKLWVNFATYLNPTPETSDLLQNIIWPPYKSESKHYLNIDEDFSVRSNYRHDVFDGWLQLYENYGEKPSTTY